MPEPILRTKTGGYSLLTLLTLIAGLALLIMQAIALFGPAPADGSSIARFLPGILGLAFVAVFLLGIRNGNVEVHPDRIKGKTAGGKAFDIPFEQIGEVDPGKRNIALRDKAGKILLNDKAARFRNLNGLLWLLTQYPELNPSAWQGKLDIAEKAPQHQAVRYFLEDESPVFGDRGFVARVDGQAWFLPLSKAALLPQRFREKGQLAVQPSRQIPVPQQDVNPAHLPLEPVWKAILNAGFEAKKKAEIAAQWAQAHGGCALEQDQEGDLVGEMGEWRIKVVE